MHAFIQSGWHRQAGRKGERDTHTHSLLSGMGANSKKKARQSLEHGKERREREKERQQRGEWRKGRRKRERAVMMKKVTLENQKGNTLRGRGSLCMHDSRDRK